MNNQTHGLCQKCIGQFSGSIEANVDFMCFKCNKIESQLIFNDMVLCLKCYQREKQYSIKRSQLKTSVLGSSLALVPKNELYSTGFLSRSGKVVKKIDKILISNQKKTNQIIEYLAKKSLISTGKISWQKLTDKCNRMSSLIYFFINKEAVFGAFHTQAIKIGENSFVQDAESGLFLKKRIQSTGEVNFYKANKSIVKYDQKQKQISFGNPSAFLIRIQGKQITVKTELSKIKYDHFFVYKV